MFKKSFGIMILAALPMLLIGDCAFGQTGPGEAVALERKGEYGPAATALERAVTGGTLTPAVVEALYYSWVRQGEYVKARDRFEALAKSNPNAAPVRLAAARANRQVGDSAAALAHLNPIQDNPERD